MNAWLLALLLAAPAAQAATASPATKPAAKPAATTPAAKPGAGAPGATGTSPAQPAKPTGQAQPGPPVSMQGRETVDASVPSKYKAKIASAQVQGALLQQEDAAVWVASNALVRAGLKPPTGATPTGWLAAPSNAQALIWKVSFTAKQAARHFSYVDIHVDLTAPPAKFRFERHEKGRDLTADELTLAKAIDAIEARSDWMRCADTYNYSASFVQGEKGGREIRVRAIPARHDAKQYLLGGFHEYTIPPQGGKSKHFQQTNTCLELPLPKNGLGFMVSSQNSDTPTLFHVFANLSYQRPVYVRTDSRTWKVDGGRVTVVDKKTLKSVKIEKPKAN